MAPTRDELTREIDALVEQQRARCLWYLRDDYYPGTDEERVVVLRAIQKHGDLPAHRRASELEQWLSRTSSATSASS